MKYIYCSFLLLLFACTDENPVYDLDVSIDTTKQVEICHNPESISHKRLCDFTCFVPNLGQNSFCWTLTREDCMQPYAYEWQRENCHFFD